MLLHSYVNGNTIVSLHDDGTKERTWNDNEAPTPVHPESMDIKITNWCDANCSFCHEKSTTEGKHADLNKLLDVLKDIPAGVEIALGGGSPTSHPHLLPFLTELKSRGLVANMTINQRHLEQYKDTTLNLIEEKLIHGVGISYTSKAYFPHIIPILKATSNVVFHLISGINQVKDIQDLMDLCKDYHRDCKVLILGYKQYGRGLAYYNENIETNKYRWYTQLASYFHKPNVVISFDNLAIKQLNVRRFFMDNAWEDFYMGDDFVFTMYVDAVEQTYAPSSTSSNRVNFNEMSLVDYFQTKRNK